MPRKPQWSGADATWTALHVRGDIDVFAIRCRPTGWHRLFWAPMPSLADQGIVIRDILGHAASGLDGAISGAEGFMLG